MKRSGILVLLALLMGLSFVLLRAGPTAFSQEEDEPAYVPGQLLIAFQTGLSKEEINNFYAEYGLAEKENLDSDTTDDNPGIKLAAIPADVNVQLIDTLESDPRIRYAEPNYLLSIQDFDADAFFDQIQKTAAQTVDKEPGDPDFGKLWGLHNTGQTGGTDDADIDALEVWDFATGSDEIIVGIIDTGVDWSHEDLKDNIWVNKKECPQGYGKCEADETDDDGNGYIDDFYGVNTITDAGDAMDDFGHGTHTAGTIGAAGDNGTGVVGINWKIKIVGCKFLSAFGSGTTANAIKCFNYFDELKNKQGYNIVVTNNSWGGGRATEALRDAMGGEDQPLHVCAAGNSNSSTIHYPAGYDLPNIISVAATDHNDRYADFSNYGTPWVDLAAPGVAIFSTVPQGRCPMCDPSGYRAANGTSMATPHVAGAAALAFSQYPELNNEQVKQRIMSGGDVLDDRTKETLTNTRLNLLNAMEDDQTPPAAVNDLKASGVLLTQANLTWTATGDDGTSGSANGYDIRYSLAPISDATWASATQVAAELQPQPAGSAESITVSDLEPDTAYYFAIKVLDNVGNASDISNVIIVRTSGGTVVFEDDMESGPDKWTIDNEDNLWHLSQRRANSPVTAWYYGDEDKGNYDTGETNRGTITSEAIEVTGADDAMLVFYEWSELQTGTRFDLTKVQVSSDGKSFQTVFESHGTEDKWERRTVSLTPYLTESGIIHVRFNFDTVNDRFNENEGWYVDDVQVLIAKLQDPGTGTPQPNLVMHENNIGISPMHPVEGDRIHVHATVLNNGAADAGDIMVQFVDVSNADVPMPIGRPQTIGSIPVGGSGTAQVVYDTTGKVGDRELRVIVDPNNFIAESNEADNNATRIATIGEPPAPNLTVQISNIGFDPAAPSAGDQVTIRATILNDGSVDAEDVVVQFLDASETRAVPIGEPQTIDVVPAGGSGVVQVTLDTTGVTDDRKIEVIADPNNIIGETDEDDNDATRTLRMISFAAPNLVVDASNIGFNPASPVEGQTVTIVATILNNGDVDASDVLIQFVDATDNSGTPIGQQQTIENIAAGGSATAQVEYATLDKAGDRKIEVIADPHNFIQESKETDNKAKGTLTVELPPAPNLVMQDENIGFSTHAPTEGEVVIINATVLNQGNQDAADVVVQFVDVSDGGARPIGARQTIDTISAGGSATANVEYATAGKDGDRAIQVVVDPSNFIAESDETDNRARATLAVSAPPAPNLVIQPSNIEFSPPHPVEGDRVSITAVVLNNGTEDARNVLVQFIDLTTGTAIPIGKEQTLPLVTMGGSASTQVTLDLAGFSRDRKIQVLVDSNNLIEESSENDNEATKILRITRAPAPNLVISADNVGFNPPAPKVGDNVTINAVIRNDGAEDAGEVLVQFVDVTSGRPVPIGQPQIIDTIAVGASGMVEVNYEATRLPGTYRIQVVVDPNNFIRETNETDNKATQTLLIAPPPAPNLTVHESNIGFAPPNPVDGDAISLTVTILNNGEVAAQDILVQFVDITDGGMTPIDVKKIIDEIPVGGSGVVEMTYQTADRTGERKIQVLVDPHSTILEEDESDNVAMRTLVVAPPPAPNLTVLDTNIGFDPHSPIEGDNVIVHVTILNNGGADASDIAVQFIDVTDDGATPIGTNQIIEAIPAGGSATAQVEYDTTNKAGDRKLQIIVDRNNLIEETDESDNEAQETLTVASPSAPNLVLKSTNIGLNPANAGQGDQVTIVATIRNDGDVDASDVVIQFTDATGGGSAPIGPPQTIDVIPAGSSATAQVTYDTTGKEGDRKIEVVVDPNNFIPEAKETDNEATKTLKMVSSPTPNLVLKSANVGFDPPAPRAGDQVVIRAVVVNNGSAEATDVVVQFVDVTDTGAPKPIGQPQTIDDIAAGSSGIAQVTYNTRGMADTDGENERKIEVKVDPNNFIRETSESDNTAKVTTELAAASAANLVILSSNVGFNPPAPIEDDPVIIHAVVLNDGAEDAGDIVVQFVDTTNGDALPIGRPQLITRIPAGSSGSAQVAYDTRGRSGNRAIQVIADPNNFVPESNEGDNRATATLPVSPPPAPNLTVLSGNIKFDPAAPGQGDDVTIAVTVFNNGTADANDVIVSIVDATNGDEQPIGAEQLIDFVPAGGSSTVEVLFNDTDVPGDRRIQVTVDANDSIVESNEDDNQTTKTLTISPPLIPNLVVRADDIVLDPASVTAGEQVTISVTIHNLGNAPAENVGVDIRDVTDNGGPIEEIDPIASIRAGGSAEVAIFYDTTGLKGNRRIQVTADPDNNVEETNENDNEATKTLRVKEESDEPVELPNVVIIAGNIKFDPSSPSAGDMVTITVNVLNMGNVDVDDVVVQFVDATDDGDDEIGKKTVTGTIEAGDSAEITMTYDTTDKAGERAIQVIGDPDGAIEESDEEDNEATKTLTVGEAASATTDPDDLSVDASSAAATDTTTSDAVSLSQPNLVVTAQDIALIPLGDGPLTIAVNVANDGTEDATDVVVQFLDVTDNGLISVGEPQYVDSIPAGGSQIVATIYSGVDAAGDHEFQVVVDPDNDIAEVNETDNLAGKAVYIIDPQAGAEVFAPAVVDDTGRE